MDRERISGWTRNKSAMTFSDVNIKLKKCTRDIQECEIVLIYIQSKQNDILDKILIKLIAQVSDGSSEK